MIVVVVVVVLVVVVVVVLVVVVVVLVAVIIHGPLILHFFLGRPPGFNLTRFACDLKKCI